jgi:small subunit ribosomal protein S4
MARITGPVCRLCRRDGLKLFLKGTRCDTPKCAIERRDVPPGMNQTRRGKLTDYGVHLREKQKVKHYYGVLERQFRGLFAQAVKGKGNTGESLMSLLERRLDNVVHRLGFGQSRSQARQIIGHGHVTVNGRRVDISSYLVRPGDVIRVKNRAKSLEMVQGNLAENRRDVPDFLTLIPGPIPEGRVVRLPAKDDVSIPVQPNLIIELLSK